MIEQLRHAIDGLNNPSVRHAAMVHFPIALASFCTLLALVSAILHKNITLRVVTIVAGAMFIGSCFVATNSGEDAEHSIKAQISDQADHALHEHEEMAEKLWMFAAALTGLTLLSAVPKPMVRHGAGVLAVLAGGGAIMWVTITAHLGGTLVYTHGLGTPNMVPVSSGISGSTQNAPVSAATPTQDAPIAANDVRLAFFREQVHPLLSQNCLGCHNPRRVAAGKAGKLDQTSLQSILKGGRSGRAIVPGKPEESLMIHRVRGDDPDEEVMPPDERLSPEAIQILMRWIADGAVWEDDSTNNDPLPAGPTGREEFAPN